MADTNKIQLEARLARVSSWIKFWSLTEELLARTKENPTIANLKILRNNTIRNWQENNIGSGRCWIDHLIEKTPLRNLIESFDRLVIREKTSGLEIMSRLVEEIKESAKQSQTKYDKIRLAKEILFDYGIRDGYNDENVIHSASNALFEKAVQEALKQTATGQYFNFDGDDNCVDCKGWDGESRRCDCGNRRVSWTVIDGTDPLRITKDDLYPEVY